MNFSIVLIAKNEAVTLPRLLATLIEFRDRNGEIVLLDTGSSDTTCALAADFGCKVHSHVGDFRTTFDPARVKALSDQFVVDGEEPLTDAPRSVFNYAAARNFAAAQATNDCIVMPDCDELFLALDIDRLEKIFAGGIETAGCRYIFGRDPAGHIQIQYLRQRFYDRRRTQWKGMIHECLSTTVEMSAIPDDVVFIEHRQNLTTDRSYNVLGLAWDCHVDPGDARNSHYLGRELYYSKRYRSAIQELARHVAMNGWPSERAQSWLYIGDSYGELASPTLQIEAYTHAFEVDSSRRAPLLSLARLYFNRGDEQRTACYAAAALEIQSKLFYMDMQTDYTSYPHELLYWAHFRLGNVELARAHWRKALAYQPSNPYCLRDAGFFMPTPRVSIAIAEEGEGAIQRFSMVALYPNLQLTAITTADIDPAALPPDLLALLAGEVGFLFVFASGQQPLPGFVVHALLEFQDAFPDGDGILALSGENEVFGPACWMASAKYLRSLQPAS